MKLRRGQLIIPFGVGSIINMPGESVMLCSARLWPETGPRIIYDERLQRRLSVSYFKMPPSEEELPVGLPFARFPRWLRCPKCMRLRPVQEWGRRWRSRFKDAMPETPQCEQDLTKLLPARFVVACKNGHIDDLPWVNWAHGKEPCDEPDLLLDTGHSGGLAGIIVACTNCRRKQSMADAFNPDIFRRLGMHCSGSRPWDLRATGNCSRFPVTLQRGASNVYFPHTTTSIYIPPFTDNLWERITATAAWQMIATSDMDCDPALLQLLMERIAQELGVPADQIRTAVSEHRAAAAATAVSEADYRYQEYAAIATGTAQPSRNFTVEPLATTDFGIKGLEKVLLVHRLRELRALVSFSRVEPIDVDLAEARGEQHDDGAKAVDVRGSSALKWYPAMEVRGEGILLVFDTASIEEWAGRHDTIKERSHALNDNYAAVCSEMGRTRKNITARMLLLHSLSHVLMRRLTFECGYSSASLKERVYCDDGTTSCRMAGILIYTASGDSEGTLGGLVRQGRSDKLPRMFRAALEEAAWCSSDPVCANSGGQGMDNLNLAACHACALVPETSCEEGNRLLDRAMLVGTPGESSIGYFSDMLK